MIRNSGRCSTSGRKARNSPKINCDPRWRKLKSFVATATPSVLGCACVDLDGVLLYHKSEWGNSRLGRPLSLGRKLVDNLLCRGFRVVVLTARPASQHQEIFLFLWKNGVMVQEVTNVKPAADFYFDDKAIPVPKNWQ